MLITQNESEAIKMDARQKRNKVLGERVVKALESRNMDAYYAETKEEAGKGIMTKETYRELKK